MGTKIQFTPLYGALGSRPLSYLLEIDALTILLDCGLGDSLDSIILQPVLQVRLVVEKSQSAASGLHDLDAALANITFVAC